MRYFQAGVLTTLASAIWVTSLSRSGFQEVQAQGTKRPAAQGWSWRLETRLRNPGSGGVRCALEFAGVLYLGVEADQEPWNAGIYAFDGTKWRLSTQFGGGREAVVSFCVFRNELYAGVEDRGEIWAYDGRRWRISLDSDENWPLGLAVWRHRMWAAIASRRLTRIYSTADGRTWHDHGELDRGAVGFDLLAFRDRLYAALSGSDYYNRDSKAGRLLSYDGNRWKAVFDPPVSRVQRIAVHNGVLFAGCFPGAKIYAYDGKRWTLSFEGACDTILSFAPYTATGRLYAGGEGRVPSLYEWDGRTWRLLRTFSAGRGTGAVVCEYQGRLYAALGTGDVWSAVYGARTERESGGAEKPAGRP